MPSWVFKKLSRESKMQPNSNLTTGLSISFEVAGYIHKVRGEMEACTPTFFGRGFGPLKLQKTLIFISINNCGKLQYQ